MPADKILNKIRIQIDALAPVLELFVDATIQPSVKDCEILQQQLSALQEQLAVYKYDKQNKELSPSFNIHAKVSEREAAEEKKAEIVKEIKESIHIQSEEKTEVTATPTETPKAEPVVPAAENKPLKTESATHRPALAVGINDKFRFINELFAQNSSEYHIAIEQINNVHNWNEADIYLNSLKNVYEWDEKEEVVKYFFSLVKKRFD
jgi:hypothetical protein